MKGEKNMPYIEAKLSVKLDDNQKDNLFKKLSNTISLAFSKPKSYIMTNIEDSKSLYMGDSKVEKGAYIAVRSLGSVSKSSCQTATKEICDILTNEYGLNGSNIYITYHPVDFWGWNGSMF